ncbi:helix-hairpin-helix domain-containing protein, partial [bacterium]|nr:helix-hairpin-helix domain-containing protein [bacterium]
IEKLDAVVGVSWHRFGTSSLYKETTLTVGIGRRLSERISIGVGLNNYDQTIVNSPNAHGFGLDVGLMFMPTNKIRLGMVVKNVNNPEVSEELKQISKVGIALIPNEKILFSLDATKATGEDIAWHIGQEYWMSENFVIRGGFENDPMSFTAGLGVRAFNWQMDYAFHSHEVMNLTHSVSMSFDFSTIPIRIPGFKWYDKESYRKKKSKKKKNKVEEIIEIEESGNDEEVRIVGGDTFYTADLKKEIHKIKDKGGKLTGPININKSDIKELSKIPGIGKRLANNILIYRYLNGDIKSEQEILKVPKITKNVWKKAKEYIRFE